MINPEKEILIFRCNAFVRNKDMAALYASILEQSKMGIILLPPYIEVERCPKNVEIKFEYNGEEKNNETEPED